MNNTITITKRADGNYEINGPEGCEGKVFELAMNTVTDVRIRLNYLKLPEEGTK